MKIYCDGSGFNGKVSGYTVLQDGQEPLVMEFKENFTSNEMEYQAVIKSLEIASEGDEIFSDSRLVVEQTKGNWAIKTKSLLPYAQRANELLQEKKCSLSWVPREENLAGLARENKTYMPKIK